MKTETSTQLMPLAVDLDGTLCHTDTLFEGLLVLLQARPLQLIKSLGLIGNRAQFKQYVFNRVELDLAKLEWNQPLINYLREQRSAGRLLCLATAADNSIAQRVAAYLGLFDSVIASRDSKNIKGPAKAHELCALFGERKFVYAGDALADSSVWEYAAAAIVVGDLQPRYSSGELVSVEARYSAARPNSLRGKLLRVYMWLIDH
jgi:phosphoglycolate phosphatase-like HAD superfamily hydrolase